MCVMGAIDVVGFMDIMGLVMFIAATSMLYVDLVLNFKNTVYLMSALDVVCVIGTTGVIVYR